MDDKLVDLPPESVVNIQEKIKHHQAQLEQKEYFLLVAGKWHNVVVWRRAYPFFSRKDLKNGIWQRKNFVTSSRLYLTQNRLVTLVRNCQQAMLKKKPRPSMLQMFSFFVGEICC